MAHGCRNASWSPGQQSDCHYGHAAKSRLLRRWRRWPRTCGVRSPGHQCFYWAGHPNVPATMAATTFTYVSGQMSTRFMLISSQERLPSMSETRSKPGSCSASLATLATLRSRTFILVCSISRTRCWVPVCRSSWMLSRAPASSRWTKSPAN